MKYLFVLLAGFALAFPLNTAKALSTVTLTHLGHPDQAYPRQVAEQDRAGFLKVGTSIDLPGKQKIETGILFDYTLTKSGLQWNFKDSREVGQQMGYPVIDTRSYHGFLPAAQGVAKFTDETGGHWQISVQPVSSK